MGHTAWLAAARPRAARWPLCSSAHLQGKGSQARTREPNQTGAAQHPTLHLAHVADGVCTPRLGLPPLQDQAYEEEEQQEGYEEEEEEEGPEVMPTDEQLALPAGRDAQQPRRQRRLQRMFEAEEEGEAAEEAAAEAEAEGEEDLPAIRGRPHGGSQRQAPAVDPQPQVPARGGEEEEEEDRPARRRRRR